MPDISYQTALDKLNPIQRTAVESIEGPVMVVAGPGTGKTQVLAMRIAHILQVTDTPAYAILALTFTESAAVNMRERVVKLIGKDGYYVNIMTFHAFCTDVLKSHPEYFPIDRQSEPLNDLEKYEMYQTIILSLELKALRPLNTPLFFIKDCISTISQLKREGVRPEEYARIIQKQWAGLDGDTTLTKAQKALQTKQRDKNTELSLIYSAYETQLRSRMRYDFDDMISLVVEAFQKHETLLMEYQEKLHYFLVDEYQDTNTSQNMVVELLASYWGAKANLFVVGDPNQSIYRFQGASIENTLEFVKKFPDAQVLTLNIGYRCPQIVYDSAHALIGHNNLTQAQSSHELHEAVSARLQRPDDIQGDTLKRGQFPSRMLELVFVGQEIKRLHEEGTPYEDIALLYRQNADSVEIQRVLEKWGIPYEIEGGENILESEMIRQLIQLMYVISDVKHGTEDEKLFEIMAYAWTDIDPVLAMKIAQSAGRAHVSIVTLISKGFDEFQTHYPRDDVTPLEFHTAEVFLHQLHTWAIEDMRFVFTEWFERLIQQSGYLKHILAQENKIELLINVNSLFREVKSLVSDVKNLKLDGFLTAMTTMFEHRMSILAEDMNIQKGVVHLSTVHRGKGREWKTVFLMHCQDGRWGNTVHREMIPLPDGLLHSTDISKKERNEDERRLFYVALTRAQEKVYIMSSDTVVTNNHSKHVIPSMFIDELGEERLESISPDAVSQDVFEHVQTLLQPPVSPLVKISDREYFADIVKNLSLSVTSLNTYLRNTDEFIQNALLKVPRAKPVQMAFGTAVHYALEMYNKARMEKSDYSKVQFVTDFQEALRREVIREEDVLAHLTHGAGVLEAYYDMYAQTDPVPVFVERFFGYGLRRTMLDDIALVGRIDRIDLLDRESKAVRVVDYKTGRTRTMGEIEGTTASSALSEREENLPEGIRGSYKRQLVFYKLLAELDPTFKYTVVEGMFDFVEPDATNHKYVRRVSALVDHDVDALKTLIREVMGEIRALKFLD